MDSLRKWTVQKAMTQRPEGRRKISVNFRPEQQMQITQPGPGSSLALVQFRSSPSTWKTTQFQPFGPSTSYLTPSGKAILLQGA